MRLYPLQRNMFIDILYYSLLNISYNSVSSSIHIVCIATFESVNMTYL